MLELSFHVGDWCAWSPSRDTEEAWLKWAGARRATTTKKTKPLAVPGSLRRYVSPLGQAALRCAWGLDGASDSRIISASRHGEFSRTLSILDTFVTNEEVAPADFTLSVHHAIAGLLSIAQRNHRGHTTIAAGPDSFGFGFIEAVTCLIDRPQESIVLVYYDEPLPKPYDYFDDEAHEPLAIALCLTAAGGGERFTLSLSPKQADSELFPVPALDFIAFMLSDTANKIVCGEHLQWHWRRHAEAA